ncbi:MAG: hypothetical protein U0800_16980 [Isosphaeraceae bacterium]
MTLAPANDVPMPLGDGEPARRGWTNEGPRKRKELCGAEVAQISRGWATLAVSTATGGKGGLPALGSAIWSLSSRGGGGDAWPPGEDVFAPSKTLPPI